MATFNITQEVVTVNAAILERPVQLPLVSVVDTGSHENYFHRVSKDTSLHRLLVDDRFVSLFGTLAKALRKSDILKTLKQMKDDEWARQVRASCGDTEAQQCKRGQPVKNLVVLPTFPSVAPQVLTVERKTLMVVLNPSTKGVVMLLTPETLEYLRNVVAAQLLIGGCPAVSHARASMSAADRIDATVANLYWSYRQGRFRAVFNPPDKDGIKQPRQEYFTESRGRALTFVQTGVRSVDTEAGNDDEDRSSPQPSEAEDEDEATATGNDDRSTAEIV